MSKVTSQVAGIPKSCNFEVHPWDDKKLFAWWVAIYFLLHLCMSEDHMHCKIIPRPIPKEPHASFNIQLHYPNNKTNKFHLLPNIPPSSRL